MKSVRKYMVWWLDGGGEAWVTTIAASSEAEARNTVRSRTYPARCREITSTEEVAEDSRKQH